MMHEHPDMKQLDIESIKPGDEIYIAKPLKIGTTPFRYPRYCKEKVIRITPKKTKIITYKDDYMVNCTSFYEETQELLRRVNVITHFITALNDLGDMSYYRHSSRNLSDDDICEYAQHIHAAQLILKQTIRKE